MTATKTVFTSNGTKVEIDETALRVRLTNTDGQVIEAGYFDTIDTPTGRKTASLYALEIAAGR